MHHTTNFVPTDQNSNNICICRINIQYYVITKRYNSSWLSRPGDSDGVLDDPLDVPVALVELDCFVTFGIFFLTNFCKWSSSVRARAFNWLVVNTGSSYILTRF